MARILISGLANMETTARVRQFPIPYYPIDYTFFGVDTDVSGVAYNIAKAMTALGDEVRLLSLLRAQIFASVKIGTSGASHGFATAERIDCLRAQFEK